jgi:hypothetical protein
MWCGGSWLFTYKIRFDKVDVKLLPQLQEIMVSWLHAALPADAGENSSTGLELISEGFMSPAAVAKKQPFPTLCCINSCNTKYH